MFGCIGRIIVLAVLIVVGAVGYVTRGYWEPKVRAKLGWKPAVVAAAPAWEVITPAGAERARTAIATLKKPTGPSFLNVKVGDLVAFALDSALHGWGPAAPGKAGAEALAGENTVSIRGTIHTKDLGGAAALGPLAGVLEGDQPIEVRGRLEIAGNGRAQLRVERIALKNLVLPSAAIGVIVQRFAPRKDKTMDAASIVLTLPREIADIRVTPGRVTLYKAAK